MKLSASFQPWRKYLPTTVDNLSDNEIRSVLSAAEENDDLPMIIICHTALGLGNSKWDYNYDAYIYGYPIKYREKARRRINSSLEMGEERAKKFLVDTINENEDLLQAVHGYSSCTGENHE